ncbi:phosphopantothenate/pantothenate synthetase [Methanoculleus sp. Wushi-C6]|uniref:4-phosphopantoate--beta-alanine ligase n=1 Tax=Methanoculleus caldifontis TaxID=2651577 RepID=A0ABU3X2Z1_9EURY|nr:4-phosphopantoate--beta-alanine ligase [Methanoculleus sp. Wushi-C6]MDV2482433.1 phosphopantothenate/pantothenate synthetase [Methanoculleus sp. Wushi-C6]
MIPKDHPRYRSLVARERLARCAREGVVALEGLTAHGRGEAFDYLIGEKTTGSASLAARTAAAMLLAARHAVISVNGNTAALAAEEIAALQQASGADVEVNLFHRTEERIALITGILEKHGARVLSGTVERLVPLSHDRALCLPHGIADADVVLVPLEDGDRCAALRAMGKTVITVDLNPLSRTARTATLTVVDEVTRAIPAITAACASLEPDEAGRLIATLDNTYLLRAAIDEMRERLSHALE